jgi:DNA-binding transcriptional MerR regulator
MKKSEAAAKSDLSIDTIRYYEKAGFLPVITRGADGNRRFTAEVIDWLTLLPSLRTTDMPMKTMQQFAALYRQGDRTTPERKAFLLAHSERLKLRAKELQQCTDLLACKLARYDEIIGD